MSVLYGHGVTKATRNGEIDTLAAFDLTFGKLHHSIDKLSMVTACSYTAVCKPHVNIPSCDFTWAHNSAYVHTPLGHKMFQQRPVFTRSAARVEISGRCAVANETLANLRTPPIIIDLYLGSITMT